MCFMRNKFKSSMVIILTDALITNFMNKIFKIDVYLTYSGCFSHANTRCIYTEKCSKV